MREVEKARLDARRELQELRRQVKMLDGERGKLSKEVTDLQVWVARDEEKEEECRRENFGLKQKVGDWFGLKIFREFAYEVQMQSPPVHFWTKMR